MNIVLSHRFVVVVAVRASLRLVLTVALLLLISFFAATAQPQLRRSVISNAGQFTRSDSMKMNSTVGQSAIGRVRSAEMQHGIGFWYGVKSLFSVPKGQSLVMIPALVADIGVNIKVPLILLQSADLARAKAKTFEAVIRYNIHVLESTRFPCSRTGDSCRITVTGTLGTNDTLMSLPFLTKLGDAEYTPLIIESFRWIEAPNALITTQSGRIDFTGICHEGDTTRLVFTTKPTALLNAYPNPASDNTTIRLQLGERGATQLVMVDVQGRTMATFLNSADARIGEHVVEANISEVPSGSYYLLLRTPTQLLSHHFVVRK